MAAAAIAAAVVQGVGTLATAANSVYSTIAFNNAVKKQQAAQDAIVKAAVDQRNMQTSVNNLLSSKGFATIDWPTEETTDWKKLALIGGVLGLGIYIIIRD
jgi:hypothetical protein